MFGSTQCSFTGCVNVSRCEEISILGLYNFV